MANLNAEKNSTQYVVQHNSGWAIKHDDSDTPVYIFQTKEEAIEKARELAENEHGDLVIDDHDDDKHEKQSSPKLIYSIKRDDKGWALFEPDQTVPKFIYMNVYDAIEKARELATLNECDYRVEK